MLKLGDTHCGTSHPRLARTDHPRWLPVRHKKTTR